MAARAATCRRPRLPRCSTSRRARAIVRAAQHGSLRAAGGAASPAPARRVPRGNQSTTSSSSSLITQVDRAAQTPPFQISWTTAVSPGFTGAVRSRADGANRRGDLVGLGVVERAAVEQQPAVAHDPDHRPACGRARPLQATLRLRRRTTAARQAAAPRRPSARPSPRPRRRVPQRAVRHARAQSMRPRAASAARAPRRSARSGSR